jgi:hypothetical protein
MLPVPFYNPFVTVRRLKTYTGSQGYVYQYYFVGSRPAVAKPAATEYIFDVTSDRKTTFSVSVFLPDEALADWSSHHGRSLTAAERYAAAKLRLFRGFDEIENMMLEGRNLSIDASVLEQLLLAVGLT